MFFWISITSFFRILPRFFFFSFRIQLFTCDIIRLFSLYLSCFQRTLVVLQSMVWYIAGLGKSQWFTLNATSLSFWDSSYISLRPFLESMVFSVFSIILFTMPSLHILFWPNFSSFLSLYLICCKSILISLTVFSF